MSIDVPPPAETEAAWPFTCELEDEAAVADNVAEEQIDDGVAEKADAEENEEDENMDGQIMPKLVNDTGPVKDKWLPVRVCDEIIGIRGGFLPPKTALSAKSLLIINKKVPLRFVELDKNAAWFLKAAGGANTQKGDLKAVCVIDDIRHKIECVIKAETAVAEEKDSQGPEEGSDYDPMDELAEFHHSKAKSAPKPKAKPKAKKPGQRSRIMTLKMPKRPICAGGEEEKVTISVYLKTANKHTNCAKRSVWLNASCIGWLLAYAADEKHFEGVKRDSVEQAKEPNCAVPDLLVEYNIDRYSWVGEFVDGPLCGTTRELFTSSITKKRWDKMIQCQIQIHQEQLGDFDAAGEVTKKQVAKRLLLLWMSALSTNQGPEFEEVWQFDQDSEKAAHKGKTGKTVRKRRRT